MKQICNADVTEALIGRRVKTTGPFINGREGTVIDVKVKRLGRAKDTDGSPLFNRIVSIQFDSPIDLGPDMGSPMEPWNLGIRDSSGPSGIFIID